MANRQPSPTPESPADPLAALRRVADSLRGQGPDEEWAAQGLLRFVADPSISLEVALGIKARRGKRNETPQARSIAVARGRAAYLLIANVVGLSKKTDTLQRIVCGKEAAPTPESQAALDDLAVRGYPMPRSRSVLFNIVKRLPEK